MKNNNTYEITQITPNKANNNKANKNKLAHKQNAKLKPKQTIITCKRPIYKQHTKQNSNNNKT